MKNITTIGLDLAKRVFQVHGTDHDGRAVLCKKLRRGQVLKFFATVSPCFRDILEAIERIERDVPDEQPRFEQNELLQTWMVHHIQLIGEAARKLSDSMRNTHPEIPWPQIITMRNVLVHD
jgi:transposase